MKNKSISILGAFVGFGFLAVSVPSEISKIQKISHPNNEKSIVEIHKISNKPNRQKENPITASGKKNLKEIRWSYPNRFENTIYRLCRKDKEIAVIKMAYRLGESELSLPQKLIDDILVQVNVLKNSGEYKKMLRRAKRKGYINYIPDMLEQKGLPKELFYLTMQESRFDNKAVGPVTRWGIAKGLWQFIPATAERYKLKTGPLKNRRVYDPDDDRHNVIKSTRAALHYIKDLHSTTDVAPSWLLVMASYNWGENKVFPKLTQPDSELSLKNFGEFYMTVKMPRQTRKYVLNIVAAAVLGENPELFGLKIPNPLNPPVYMADSRIAS